MIGFKLDGRRMSTREAAHEHIAERLSVPEYYGRNLDALWDMISGMDADVTLRHADAMLSSLGAYGCRILSTLYEAAEENPGFHFSVEAEEPCACAETGEDA